MWHLNAFAIGIRSTVFVILLGTIGCCNRSALAGVLWPRSEQQQQQQQQQQTGVRVRVDLSTRGTVSAGELDGLDNERTLSELAVSENTGGLLPMFCPSEPFERYARLHRDILEGNLGPRFLVYRPDLQCGMGNRIRGFRGVLALAMMTDRALLVDWYGGLRADQPDLSYKFEDNFLKVNGIPWNSFPPDLDLEDNENYDGATKSTEVWCQTLHRRGIRTRCTKGKLNPHFLSRADWEQVYAQDAKVVVVQAHTANIEEILRLNNKPGVVEALRRLDDEIRPSLFDTCSLRFLFQARTEFKDEYCQKRSTVLNGYMASVSLHIRAASGNIRQKWLDSLPQDVDNFVECAAGLDEGLAIVAANSTGPDHELFRPFGDGFESRWILGTDTLRVIDIMKEGNHMVEQGGKVAFVEGEEGYRTHTQFNAGLKPGHASWTNVGPLLDLALLSEAPLFVGSYKSTFSEESAVLGGRPAPLRLKLGTPFQKVGSHNWGKLNEFQDYRQGCRDLVSSPSAREDLRLSMQARLEPWIACEDETRG